MYYRKLLFSAEILFPHTSSLFSFPSSCVQAGLLITQRLRRSLTNPAVNLVLDSWVGLFLSPSVCIFLSPNQVTHQSSVPFSVVPVLPSLSIHQYNLFILFLLIIKLMPFYSSLIKILYGLIKEQYEPLIGLEISLLLNITFTICKTLFNNFL